MNFVDKKNKFLHFSILTFSVAPPAGKSNYNVQNVIFRYVVLRLNEQIISDPVTGGRSS